MNPGPNAEGPAEGATRPGVAATTGEPTKRRRDGARTASSVDAQRDSHRSLAERDLTHFLAMLLMALAVLIALAVQCAQLLTERASIEREFAAQARALEGAAQLRGNLDRLARGIHRLSEQGYPVGRALAADLRKRGIVIDVSVEPPVVLER
jgi:hypothetical protein